MSLHPYFTVAAVILWIPWGQANAQLAGTFEPFSYQANAESWLVYDHADDTSYMPEWDFAGDGLNPDIHLSFFGSNALDFYADEFASGGSFVGDLAAAGVDAIGCEILIEDINSFDAGEFFLFSATTNRYYFSEYITPDASGWDVASASLTGEDWYILENGAYVPVGLTPEILSDVTEIGVTFYPLDVPEADGKVVGIDKFTFYGALQLPGITTSATGGSFQVSFDRRPGIAYSIQSSTDLATWTLVPGQESIVGTTPYTMTRPLAPGSRFFRVGIEDFLTPVPEMMSAP